MYGFPEGLVKTSWFTNVMKNFEKSLINIIPPESSWRFLSIGLFHMPSTRLLKHMIFIFILLLVQYFELYLIENII